MSLNKNDRNALLHRLIVAIGKKPNSFSPAAFANMAGVSVQSIYRYLAALCDNGKITIAKNGNRNIYKLVEQEEQFEYSLHNLSEDIVWKKDISPFFAELSETAFSNMAYAFTEMLNNAIDHSGGECVKIFIAKDGYKAKVWIYDDGIGIFNKIASAMGFEEKSFAILELAKGKFTTDPCSHTGEGVFFSSKVMDDFAIISDGLIFLGPKSNGDAYIDSVDIDSPGTCVMMEIEYDHCESKSAVFDKFTQAPDDYGFSKTIVPVRLLEYGDEKPQVVSRSQAKRLMVRFERFQNIILDFSGIDEIGQGFADELFRVFANQHPGTKLTLMNCNKEIKKMISRVRSSDGVDE